MRRSNLQDLAVTRSISINLHAPSCAIPQILCSLLSCTGPPTTDLSKRLQVLRVLTVLLVCPFGFTEGMPLWTEETIKNFEVIDASTRENYA
jgi:hypothetical protein